MLSLTALAKERHTREAKPLGHHRDGSMFRRPIAIEVRRIGRLSGTEAPFAPRLTLLSGYAKVLRNSLLPGKIDIE